MEIDRSYALIHLDNLLYNYNQIKKQVANSNVLAVVKADAYGHGAVKCARRLEANGCTYFAVACLKEAIELREAGINGNILIFGRTNPLNHCYLSKYNLIQSVCSIDYARELNTCGERIRVHVNVDTGMSRFGIYFHKEENLESVVDEIKKIQELEYLKYEGLYTHFANSDKEDKLFCNQQFGLYQLLIDRMNEENIFIGLKHVSNSSAIINHPDKYLDMVRLGIGLYGYPHSRAVIDLLPVMEVFGKVVSIRTILAGDTVSYGRVYTAKRTERIATIGIGYADGYNRLLTNKDYLVYKNKKLPVIGRVCMDAIVVRIDDLDIHIGEAVEVFGLHKPLESMCEILNTIPYELLCNVSKRVIRLYD
ncbi:MAG: alanine racemase [Tenericutes bacterium]|nr:alanine racemase [Mycoplasmatota bacterium]